MEFITRNIETSTGVIIKAKSRVLTLTDIINNEDEKLISIETPKIMRQLAIDKLRKENKLKGKLK